MNKAVRNILLILITVFILSNAPSAVATTTAWHINAAGTDYTDGSGNLFVADKAYVAGDFGYTGNSREFTFANEIAGTEDDTLYQSLRSGFSFGYDFDISDGDYDVTLYFMEPWQSAVGERLFDVTAEGTVVLDDYDIFAVAGAQFTAVNETFSVTVSDGQLNLDFDSVSRVAMVSAISVQTAGDPVADISVAPTSLDFGDVEEQTTSDLDVTVTNDGDLDLTVSDLSVTNAEFSVVSPAVPFTVAPGGSQAVTVRFSPADVGAESGNLDISSDDPDEAVVSVALTGNGVAPPPDEPEIDVTPLSLDFGQVEVGTDADQVVTIANSGLQPLTVSSISSSNGTFTVVSPTAPFDVAAESSTDVTVRFTPDAEQTEAGDLTITSNDADEGTVIVSLAGEGITTPAVAYRINSGGTDYTDTLGNLFVADKAYAAGDFGYSGNVRSFDFSNEIANTDDDLLYQTVNVNTALTYLFDLDNGSYDVTMYFMEPFQSAVGERIFDVTAEDILQLDDYDIFATAGAQFTAVSETFTVEVTDGQLSIQIVRENRSAIVSAIAVVSEGGVTPPADPDIDVSPLSVDFGQVVVGNTADQVVTVTNTGGMTLTISSMDSSNSLFTIESPAAPFDLLAGESQPVTVRFEPAVEGVETADLTINSNDADEAAVIVSLTGEGTTSTSTFTTYTDVTAAAGVNNSHLIATGICPPDDNPPIGNGAAWADYDSDGDVDVYVTNQSGANWLYSNDGDGTFTDMAAAAGVAASSQVSFGTTFIDYDNDGDQDLWVGGHGGNLFFENNGDSTFTDVTSASGLADGGRAITAGWADFNEDGYLDVYLGKHKYCAGDDRQEDKLFVNNGDGSFTDVTTDYLCNGVASCDDVMGLAFVPGWLDYDNDGDLDIFLVNDDIGGAYQPTKLFRNDGADGSGGWTFTEVSTSAGASYSLNGMGLGVGDYDNDGNLDMAFSHMGPAVLLNNNGDGTFSDATSSTIIGTVTGDGITWGTAFFDHDNDGYLDLYFVHGSLGVGGSNPNYFFGNNGDGTFSDLSSDTGLDDGGRGRALATADFDGDGFMDVFVGNYGQTPALLQNDGNSNNWLSITVEGTDSNRDGIGTRLILTAGGASQVREISSGSSHGGGDQRIALFGLGSESAGTLVVEWPNGEVQDLGSISANQSLHLVEPAVSTGGTTYEDVTAQVGITAVDTLPADGCGVPAGNGIAWADYDNDSDVDVYIANHNGSNYLYRNEGDTDSDGLPNFTNVASTAGVELAAEVSMSAVFIDVDNDGDQDIYVTNDGGNTLFESQLIDSGSATFTDITTSAGVADTGRAVTSAWADFNNDSYLDFYVAKHQPCALDNTDQLYMNNGDNTFTNVTSYLCGGASTCAQVEGLGFSPAFLDYDNDGDVDLHLVNDDIGGANYPNVLWRNDGSDGSGGWIFTDVSAAAGADVSLNGMGQGVGDYNNDGWLDIAYSNGAPGRLLENNGDGTFTDVSQASNITTIVSDITWGTVFFDYDNDGDEDLYFVAGEVAAQTSDVNNFMLDNNGDSTFSDISAASGLDHPGRGRSASIVDFDNDGFVDVMVGSYGEAYSFYRNDGAAQGNTNHWLTITVAGTESNRDGIGTRINVTAGGVTQIREINSGPTHGGGDYRAGFFGLGANTSATVEIEWPNGVVESIGTVSVDQQLHYVEPSSAPATPDIDVPASISFGDVETGTSRDKLVSVTNTGTTTLTVSSATTTNVVFTVEGPTVPFDVAPGATTDVTVRFSPTSDGAQTADLTLESNDPDEDTVTVALSGTGVTAASTTFVDVIDTAGIDSTHTLSDTCSPPIGAGSAWADYDNDGDIDVYITDHGAANNLYRNEGDTDSDGVPNFTDVAATYGLEDAAGVGHATNFIDYDNDGDQDLYVSNWGASYLYQNQLIETGSVAFTDVTAAAGISDDGRTVTAAWADFDNDGYLDLYLAKHAYCGSSDPRNFDKLFHNNGDGTFTDVTSWLCTGCDPIDHALGFAAGWFDYDNDGDLDLYVVNDILQGDGSGGSENYHNVLWRNDGSDGSGGWNFTEVSTAANADTAVNGMGLGVGDYDNDGDFDVAFSDIGFGHLLSNDGDGTFTDVSDSSGAGTGSLTWGTAFFDHDNDGWVDLFFASGLIGSGGSTPDIFLQNNADGTFTDISVTSGLNNDGRGRHAAMVDFDMDGLVDLFVGNYGTPAALYQNRADVQGNSNNWLFITVEGTDSNRDGIGTRLTLTADGVTMMREINSGPTHGGGDYRAAYFGLGGASSGTLTVEWPNGQTEVITISSGDINQYMHLVEPANP